MAKVTVYTSPWCGYCSRVRRLLESKGVPFEEIDISRDPGLQREMIERSGRFTVPQVFVGETHVGGSDDLLRMDRRGELDELLERDRQEV